MPPDELEFAEAKYRMLKSFALGVLDSGLLAQIVAMAREHEIVTAANQSPYVRKKYVYPDAASIRAALVKEET